MRLILVGVLLGGVALPSTRPKHHNIPATWEGKVVYLCATKVRLYQLPSGKVVADEDHYISEEGCPKEPVK